MYGERYEEMYGNCGHTFCRNCIEKMSICPVCEKPVTEKNRLVGDEYERERRELALALQNLNARENARQKARKATRSLLKTLEKKEEERADEELDSATVIIICMISFLCRLKAFDR